MRNLFSRQFAKIPPAGTKITTATPYYYYKLTLDGNTTEVGVQTFDELMRYLGRDK